jgi:molybdenum cofactor guanylyltransferase
MKIGGVIVAGGTATRMGRREKLLLQLGGRPLLDLILCRVCPQVDAIAIDVRYSSRHLYDAWRPREIAVISDPFSGQAGPLGGVVAGLLWLAGLGDEFEWLATFPGDTPFLPHDLVRELGSFLVRGSARPVVAIDQERVQSLCALWPATCLRDLGQGVRKGHLRSVRRALDEFDAIRCPVRSVHSFINVNTERDLADAGRLIEELPQMFNAN